MAPSLRAAAATGEASLFVARVATKATGEASIRGFAMKGERHIPKSGYLEGSNPDKLQLVNPFEWPARRLEIDIIDERGERAILQVFGAIGTWKNVPAGEPLVLRGQAKFFGNRIFVNNPEWVAREKTGDILPVYVSPDASTSGASISAMIDWALQTPERAVLAIEAACSRIREACGMMEDAQILELCAQSGATSFEDLPSLIAALHRPKETTREGLRALGTAHAISALALQCEAQAKNTRRPCPDAVMGNAVSIGLNASTLARQVEVKSGFKLTSNQRAIITQAAQIFARETPMNALLNGEVGSGKTAVFGVLSAVAWTLHKSVVIMAPTDLLADQHAQKLAALFSPQVSIERVKTGHKIRNPRAILVGTSGLATAAAKAGVQPDFLVLDEQHKMSAKVREALVFPQTHVMEVSATPIPRTMALSMYKGLDVFMLTEQPVVRNIHTSLIDESTASGLMNMIRGHLAKRERTAIVFSLVEDKPETESTRISVAHAAAGLEAKFPGQVVVLHGKMKPAEKEAALTQFRAGTHPIIVTTSIFETGIDVPDVRLLVVRNPESMGLSQLHQLRGRLARNGGEANCVLLAEDLKKYTSSTFDRLDAFTHITDGYELARRDLAARDAGEASGLSQSGRAKLVFKALQARASSFALQMSENNPQGQGARPSIDMVDAHTPVQLNRSREERLAQQPLF